MKNWSVFIVIFLFVSLLFAGCWFPPPPDPVEVQSISLDQEELTLVEDATVQLTATVLPEDASNKNVTWQTSDPELAAVDDNGLVTALNSGAVTITAISESGGFESYCVISVLPSTVAVSSVVIDNESISVAEGQSAVLSVSILPADATNKNVGWASLDERIATVDQNGTVSGVSEGVVTITATSEDGGLSDSCVVTVTALAVSVSGVDLEPETLHLVTGESNSLTATVLPAEATNKNVEWSSSNPEVLTVDETGKVLAVAEGTATITVTSEDGGLTDSCTVTVTDPVVSVTGVVLDADSLDLETGDSSQLTATVLPADASNTNVTWASDNSDAVTVDNAGNVNAVAEGTATITVTSEDGGLTDSCTVTVTDPVVSVTGVVLDADSLDLETGDSSELTATVLPADASNKNISWASSNTGIVTVDNSGNMYAAGEGIASITVTSEDGGLTDSCVVTVTDPVINVTSVVLDLETLDLVTGNSASLAATVYPADATNKNVDWLSGNSAVVTVDNSGNVYAAGEGAAIITVRTEDGSLEDTCAVTVSDIHVSSVSLNQNSLSLDLSDTASLSVTVGPSNATNKAVSWSSSDPNIATVNQSGFVTAVNYGEAEITVSTLDGGLEAVCEVIVRDPDHFITVWDMSLTTTNTLTFPIYNTDNDFDIDWGDGTVEHHSGSGALTHNYGAPGVYTVTISGSCNGFGFNLVHITPHVNTDNLVDIAMWGRVRFHNVGAHFANCSNLTGFSAPGNPDLSGVTDFHSMFALTDLFNADIGDWDLSAATMLSSMFYEADGFNQDLSDWDVGNVEYFNYLFLRADLFTNGGNPEGLENWDVDETLTSSSFIMTFKDCPLDPVPSWYP